MASGGRGDSEPSFLDFTVASAFERLVADVEACLTTWKTGKELRRALSRHAQQQEQGSSEEPLLVRRAQLRHRLPFRSEPYTLALHLLPPQHQHPSADAGPHSPRRSAAPAAVEGAAAATAGAAAATAAGGAPVPGGPDLWDAPHRLQAWFGLGPFLLLTPDSYSGRVLEAEEEHTLLSAAAVALSHARCPWPLLLPVHDAVRDGYRGVAAVQPAAGAQAAAAGAVAAGCTVKFDTDSLHSSRLPEGLLRLDQLLLLFAKQLAAAGAPAAAAACRAAVAAELEPAPASMAADAAAARVACGPAEPEAAGLEVAVAVRHCYALPSPGDEQASSSAWGDDAGGSGGSGEWDERAPWRPWAAQADPIGCLELDVVWRFPTAAAALQAAAAAGELAGQEVASASLAPAEAAEWRLLALSDSYERDTGQRGFVLRPGKAPGCSALPQLQHWSSVDKQRRFLHLQSLTGRRAHRILAGSAEVAPAALPADSSFHGMLLKLLESCKWAARAPALGSLASADWWPQQGAFLPPAPPEWVLREAIRDIFQLPVLPVWPGSAAASVSWPTSDTNQHGCLGKAAPLGALISRFTLHALALGSPRAVAELWSRFVSTLRLTYWEQLQPLPRMQLAGQPPAGSSGGGGGAAAPSGGAPCGGAPCGGGPSSSGSGPSSSSRPEAPNLELCLLHQKLQLLDLCIHLQAQRQQVQQGKQRGGGRTQRTQQPQQQPQQQQQSDQAALQWEASWGNEEEPEEAGQRQQGSQAALDWEASWGESDSNGDDGQQEAPSPSNSSSSYHSARAGSEASLSPVRQQRAAVASPPAAEDASQQAPSSSSSPARGLAVAAEPRGAIGELPGASLHMHPNRPLRIPAVQEPPVYTEDTLAESQAALQSLPAGDRGAAALRSQLQGRLLASDMQAFKAANPGACLLDFVRWHSPKDCRQAQDGSWHLSGRMAAEGNVWQQLWDAAKPVPATQQRPLFDPRLEGERALHFLETLPPPALFSELLALGFSAAVQVLLVASPAADLPAVWRQLACLVAAAEPEMQHGVAALLGGQQENGGEGAPAPAGEREADAGSHGGTSASLSPAASPSGKAGSHSAMSPQRQPSWVQAILGSGLSSEAFRRLLLLLGSAEQATVAAHSLLLRLDPQQLQAAQEERREEQQQQLQQQQRQQQVGTSSSMPASAFAAQAADGLMAAALGEAEQLPGSAAVRLTADAWAEAEALLTQRQEWDGQEEAAASHSGSSASEEGWPEPFQREWLLQVGSGGAGLKAGPTAAAAAARSPPGRPSSPGGSSGGWLAAWEPGAAGGHRLYAKALPSECRIATAVAPEI